MKKTLSFLLFFFLFSVISFAQTPSPTNSPQPAENEGDIIKINTSLIQIDVIVTDKEGKIVTDLKPDDFEIFENNEKQKISNFSFVSSENSSSPIEKSKTRAAPRPFLTRPEEVRRTIALVVDDLQTNNEGLIAVRRSLRKFVDEQMQPNDLVAILLTGSGMGVSQQFTNDKRLLYAAIDNIKCNLQASRGCLPLPVETEDTLASVAEARKMAARGRLPPEGPDIKESEFNSFREDVFTVGTLGALDYIVNGMKEMPGRKSIMFFSDGFSFVAIDKNRSSRVYDTLRKLTELANRASVTIYSFDARGLVASMPSVAVRERQKGLFFLANETGGRAFFENNDLNEGLDKALGEQQQAFYLIGYQQDNDAFDPKNSRSNKLEIKVKRPGLTVRHRSGFFGVVDQQSTASLQNSATQLLKAITSPFVANNIPLKLNTVFGNKEKEGSFVQSFLHVDAKELQFIDEPGGWKKAVFEVLAVSFGENGAPVDRLNNVQTFRVKDELYKTIINKGFVYNFIFPIKKTGAYQMRVALRDINTSKIGSAGLFIEVPDLKKEQLILSGIILEGLTGEQLRNAQTETQISLKTDPMTDTSLRRFKKGTVLRYGLEVYNAKLDSSRRAKLQSQIKIFRDGKPVLEGKLIVLNGEPQISSPKISLAGALELGQEISAGEYVLQINVTDNLAKINRSVASQLVQFEVTD